MGSKVGHPVYPVDHTPEEIRQMEQRTAPLMGMNEAEMTSLAPDRTGFRYTGCPNCDGGASERQLSWSIERPFEVTCKYCGMVFPNETFPEDRELRIVNPAGVEVVYPYWEDDTGYRYFFSGKGWWEARFFFAERAKEMGALYQATGDRAYARRAALILDAFARYYPGFLVWEDVAHYPKVVYLEPPFPRRGGKWGEWRYSEIPVDLIFAYDSIYASGELERLAEETGADVKARVEEDLFRGGIRQDGFHGVLYTNASPQTYEGYAVAGRVLGDPALVHEAVRRTRGFCSYYFVDGFWCQGSVSYHGYTMRGLKRVLDALKGHSDPPGYVDPVDGTRFEDLDLERMLSIVGRAKRVLEVFFYPDGRRVTMHDAWPRFEAPGPPEQTVSMLFEGLGHAWLAWGEGKGQGQAHLHFSEGGHGHDHADNLNLMLFARGEELLPDLGYTHTFCKPWSKSTLCHNTVVIDEADQYTQGEQGPSGGRLLAFEADFEPVQWMEAGAEQAYPGVAEVYRRAVFTVQAGAGDAYVVDLFRVKGGSQHDWALHPSVDRDVRAEVDAPLSFYGENLLPGVKVRFPTHERDDGDAAGRNVAYAFVENVRRGKVEGGARARFDLEGSPVGVRTHLLSEAEVFLGDAPSVRRAEEDEAMMGKYRMPFLLARRQGAAPLTSLFAAVHEPFEGVPFVESAELAEEGDAAVLTVRHRGGVDHIVHRTGEGDAPLVMGDFYLDGEAAFVRERNGAVEMMALWGGRMLRWKEAALSGEGTYERRVKSVLRSEAGDAYNALVVDGALPEGDALKGKTAVVSFGDGSTLGYRIVEVKRSGRETHVALEEDPGIAVEHGGMRHLFFPLREIAGAVTCRIRMFSFARF